MARTRTNTNTVASNPSVVAVVGPRATHKAPTASKAAPTVAPYRVVTLASNPKLVALACKLATEHPGNQAAAATAMAQHMPTGRCTTGQLAYMCYQGGKLYNGTPLPLARYGTTDAGAPSTPQQLAQAIAAQAPGTPGGYAWGPLSARYGVTEATARAAFSAATGRHHSTTGAKAWAWRNSA